MEESKYGRLVDDGTRRIIVRWSKPPRGVPEEMLDGIVEAWFAHVCGVRLVNDHKPRLHRHPVVLDRMGYVTGGGVASYGVTLHSGRRSVDRDWAVITLCETAFEYGNSREHAQNCSSDFIAGVTALGREMERAAARKALQDARDALQRADRAFKRKEKRLRAGVREALTNTWAYVIRDTWDFSLYAISDVDGVRMANVCAAGVPSGWYPTRNRWPDDRMTIDEAVDWVVAVMREHALHGPREAVAARLTKARKRSAVPDDETAAE